MATPRGQIVAFRARFHSRRKGFVTVRVFATEASMHRYVRQQRPYLQGALASCFGFALGHERYRVPADGPARKTPDHGEIVLLRTHLDAEPVVHECAHMALAYARRKRLDPLGGPRDGLATTDEETFCYALGGLTTSVMAGLRRHRLVATVKGILSG